MLTLPKIFSFFSLWGYTLIFPIAVLEGPIVGTIAGFLVSLGRLDGVVVFLILMLADFCGDLLYYGIGRYGHGPRMRKLVRWIGVTPERMEKLEASFRKHDFKILLLNKTQAAGAVVLYFCGAIRMPLGRFLWINVLGSVPKVLLFETIGFYFGKSYLTIQKYIDYAGLITTLLAVAFLAGYWYLGRRVEKAEGLEP